MGEKDYYLRQKIYTQTQIEQKQRKTIDHITSFPGYIIKTGEKKYLCDQFSFLNVPKHGEQPEHQGLVFWSCFLQLHGA
jgi:hypothetical protein